MKYLNVCALDICDANAYTRCHFALNFFDVVMPCQFFEFEHLEFSCRG
jgi:hypothetical protein